jgi:phage head maturation protease
MSQAGPPGFVAGKIQHRFVDEFGSSGPLSFDRESRTVDAVLSRGSPVQRVYGTEILRISPSAVDLSRVNTNSAPLLDSHNQIGVTAALGRVSRAWFDDGALVAKLKFNETPQGEQAMGMVGRGELSSLSAGYRVDAWEIRDEDGDIIDPEVDRVRWDDNLTFTATKWQLLEASLVLVPADDSASIRSLGGGNPIADVRARMVARTRMMARQSQYDDRVALFGSNFDE